MITKLEISKAADKYACPTILDIKSAEDAEKSSIKFFAFREGARWALRQQRWMPVEKELPAEDDNAVAILFKNPFFGVMTVERGSAKYNHEDKKWYSPLTGGRLIQIEVHNVTHWQPLPPLPTEAP